MATIAICLPPIQSPDPCLPSDPAQRVTGETPIVRHNEIKKSVTVVPVTVFFWQGKGRDGKVHYAISRAMPAVQTQSTRHNTTYSIQGGQIWKIEIRWHKNCPICAPATPRQLVAYEFELQHLA